MVRTLIVALLLLAGCGDSPKPQCPPCPAPAECDPQAGVCVMFRTPVLDALGPDGPVDGGSN